MKISQSIRPALLAGALPFAALLPAPAAWATTCNDGAAATIDTANCTVAPGTEPTTVTFLTGPTGSLILNGASPTGAINATTANQGNITVQASTTLNAGATIGATTSIGNITVNSGQTLDARAVSTINANNIILGNGTANGKLTLGNTIVTVAGRLDGDGGGGGNMVTVDGNATINGLIGTVAGTDITVNDGKSLTTNSATYRATTTLGSGGVGGATLTWNGNTSVQGWINGDAAGKGVLVVNGTATLGAGVNLGSVNSLAQITVNSGKTLNATNAGTISATNIIVGANAGSGLGNGTLTLGNTTVTTTGVLDGAGGAGNVIVVAGNATINGNIGTYNGIDTRVNDGRSLTTTGNVRSTIWLGNAGGGNATITLQGSNKTLIGAINGDAAGKGDVVIDGTITSSASLGTITSLDTVTVNAGRSLTLSGSASITATNGVAVGNGATLTVGSGVVTGTIDGVGANQGSLIYTGTTYTNGTIGGTNALNSVMLNSSANLTLRDNVAASTVTMANSARMQLANAATITGNLDVNNAQLDLRSNVLTVTNGLDVQSGRGFVLATTLGSGAGGYVDLSGGAFTIGSSGAYMFVNPTLSGRTVSDGDRVVVVNGTTAATLNGGALTSRTSGLVSWSARVATAADAAAGTDIYGRAIDQDNDVVLVATVQKASELPGVDKENAKPIDVITSVPPSNPKVTELVSSLQNLTTASEVNTAGAQLRPEAGRGSVEAAVGSVTQALAVVGNRAETIRTAMNGKRGISTGEMLEGTGLWAEGFGALADQKARGTSEGYEASTAGLAFGADTRVSEPLRVGIAGSYSQTWMDEKGSRSRNGNDIESYGVILYSSYAGEPWYLDTSVGVALHRYDSQRAVNFSGFNGLARGEHDGLQYTAKTEAGYPIAFGNTTLTPLANVTWTRLNQEAYTETGDSGANLAIDRSSNDSLTSGLGAKLSRNIETSHGMLVPEIRALWLHEFIDSAPQTTARFTTGGSSFTTDGMAPSRNGALLGLGLTLLGTDQLELSANVDVELREGYVGQSGRLRLRSSF